jgi:hypothetical protein
MFAEEKNVGNRAGLSRGYNLSLKLISGLVRDPARVYYPERFFASHD